MNTDKKVLFENISSLFLLQISGYVIPLIILPFLVRTLGSEMYGLMVFSFSLVQYFIIFTDYGFNLSATRRVSINRADRRALSEIFTSVTVIKCVTMVLSFMLFLGIILAVDSYHKHLTLFLVSFLAVLGNVLLPIWLFQGLEKIRQIAIVSLIGRILSLFALLLFIRSPDDVVLAAAIQAASVLISGIFAFVIISKDKMVDLVKPSKIVFTEVLTEGWPIFISQLSVSLFTNTGVFLLGGFYSYQSAGYFAIADKIIKAACGFATPIVNAIYPRVSALFTSSKQRALKLLRKALIWGGGLFISLCSAIFIFSPMIVKIITGYEQPEVVVLLRVMSVVPLSAFIDNIYGTQILLNIHREQVFMSIIVISGIISLSGLLLFVPKYGALASAVVFTATELILLAMMIFAVRREGIRLLLAKTVR